MRRYIFLSIRVCRSICQAGLFLFLALSICKTELIWPVSKGSPSSNILGLYKLMFIYLTGLLFFSPRAGEAGLAGSNCEGEQCVLRAQCPSSIPSPFCTHAGQSPSPLLSGPGFFSCPIAQSSRRSHRADWCSPGRGDDLAEGPGSVCFLLCLFSLPSQLSASTPSTPECF